MKLLKRITSAMISAVCTVNLISGSMFVTSFASETTFATTDAREKIERIVELVNEERAKEGISPVIINETLTDAAMLRAEELAETFEHTRPDGTSCFTVLDDFGIGCWGCAENIAAGSSTADATMTQWINSPGHYENLMTPEYTEIGVGYYYDPDSKYEHNWVQLFIDPINPIEPTEPETNPDENTGDVNGDGETTMADVVMIQKYVLNIDSDISVMDVNEDDKLDVFDVIFIRRIVLDNQ